MICYCTWPWPSFLLFTIPSVWLLRLSRAFHYSKSSVNRGLLISPLHIHEEQGVIFAVQAVSSLPHLLSEEVCVVGMLKIYLQQISSIQYHIIIYSNHAASFVKVVQLDAKWTDVLDKKVKASGFPVLWGLCWARQLKFNYLDDDFLLSYTDPML